MVIYEAVDKRFLNLEPHEGGSICWDVQVHQNRRKGTANIDSSVYLADCYKQISLEFCANTAFHFSKRIDKLDTMIESLHAFRAALHEARREKIKAIVKYREEHKGERFKSKETSDVCEDGLARLDC